MRLTFSEGLIQQLIVNANTIELVEFLCRNGKPDAANGNDLPVAEQADEELVPTELLNPSTTV